MRRHPLLLPADLGREVRQLEVRSRQGATRGRVRLLAEQRGELAIELGGRPEEPIAQLLELVLLEQEVLAGARVKGLDRLDRQVLAGLHGGLGAAQFGIGGGRGRSRVRLAGERGGETGVGRRLDGEHRQVADHSAVTAAAAPVTPVRWRVDHRSIVRVHGSRQAESGSSAIHRSTSSASARAEP
jgi:hypothetical protein